jgi:branched-chain amino acid aminotransferase
MPFKYFARNDDIVPVEQASVPLSNIEYSYGYGVYENIRVSGGKPQFLDQHLERLIESACTIELNHDFKSQQIKNNILNLLSILEAEACNLKVLLIGGLEPQLYVLPLSPLFADRKLYRDGAHAITYHYERLFPHAKTLNMLPSYLAYRDARQAGAYDALLVNHQGNVTEGTRTNFFAITGKTLYTPPGAEILLGVTRDNVLRVAREKGYDLVEQDLPANELSRFEGVFLTSTSSKIMPLSSIDEHQWQIPDSLRELMTAFNEFLEK